MKKNKSTYMSISIQLLPVGCHPERSEGSNNLEILRLSASE